jgi:hypothetical protein
MDPKLSRLIETQQNIGSTYGAHLKSIFEKAKTRGTYSRNRNQRNINSRTLRTISKKFSNIAESHPDKERKKQIGEKADYLTEVADYINTIEELPETIEESRNKGLPVLAEPAQPKSESRKSRSRSEDKESAQSSYVSVKSDNPCPELFDPCTREPIANNDIKMLESRVREIRKNRDIELNEKKKFPIDKFKSRLDLLLFVLQQTEKPNENLLQYDINGQLFESYWDIVFALGLIDQFPITEQFFMFKGKIETLTTISDPGFMKNPFDYLAARNINEGSKAGASDVTFMYNKRKTNPDNDDCSAETLVIPNVSEVCRTEVASASSRQSLEVSEKPLLYFCSAKYYKKDDTKGIDKFDIQNIYTAAKNLNQDYDKKIILLVKDRGAVEEKMAKAIRKYIADEARYIFGMSDLFAALTKLYNFVHEKHTGGDFTKEKLQDILGIKTTPKPILNLRLHQHIAVLKITDSVNTFKQRGSGNNKFLVGIVPRGGKTFIAGGIIHTLQPKKVVVLLGAKSETLSQFKNDLFEYFQNFSDYTIIDALEQIPNMRLDPVKKYIILMSVELYKTPDSTRVLLQNLKMGSSKADLFICDEAHLKQTTERARVAMDAGSRSPIREEEEKGEELVSDAEEEGGLKQLDNAIGKDIPVVYMTGTYIKPMTAFSIPPENCIIWDYQDIQEAKNLSTNEDYFKENFGEYYGRALNICTAYGESFETIQNQYRKFPELYLLTTQFTQNAKNAFLKQDAGKAIGYPTITHLFEVKKDFDPKTTPPERWASGFTNLKGILRLMNYLSPSTASIKNVGSEKIQEISSVLTSVDHIAQRIGDRLAFFTSDFVVHSQLWFLPHMQGHPLKKRMCALAGAIFQSKWFAKNFVVIAVSGTTKDLGIGGAVDRRIKVNEGTFTWACPKNGESLKQCLLNEESKARRQGKGLIIMAQNMLHLGISLPCVDIVVLLDAGEKVDERIQKMYRALTESTNKKGGYIIDMNYFRTVTAIMNYQIETEKQRKKKQRLLSDDIPKLFNKVLDIFSIDDDKPILRSDIEKDTLPELQKLLGGSQKSGDSTVLSTAGAALDKNVMNVLDSTYSKDYDKFLGLMKEEAQKTRALRELEENSPEKATRAKEAKENKNENAVEDYNEPKFFKEQDNEKQRKEAYLDIFKTTLKLGAFGTEHTNLEALLVSLNNDKELRETLFDTIVKRGAIQEDKANEEQQRNMIIDGLIIPAIRKIVGEGRDDSYQKMKESIDNNRKYPAEIHGVLQYITEHLAPKAVERQMLGEVFTPLNIIEDLLSKLPKKVWKEHTWKWLDPANGMGNFPIIAFIHLDEGLKEWEPNEAKRRKHIVENMLFMIEINPKNSKIARRLFSKLAPEAQKINILTANTLKITDETLVKNFGVEKFNIIMGNPPFNSGGSKIQGDEDASTIWPAFFEYSMKYLISKGYLIFLHPPIWRVAKKSLYQNVYKTMTTKQIVYLKSYEKDSSENVKSKFEGTDVRFESYILQNEDAYEETLMKDIFNKESRIKVKDIPFIPNSGYDILKKLFSAQKKYGKLNYIDKWEKTKIVGNVNKITNMSNTNGIDYTVEKIKYKDQEKIKVCTNGETSRWPVCFVDKGGKEEAEQYISERYILCKSVESAKKVAEFLSSKLFYFLVYVSHFQIQARTPTILYNSMPNVEDIEIDFHNDTEIYKLFNITEEDIKLVEKYAIRRNVLTERELHVKGNRTRGVKPDARHRTRKLRRFF